MMQVAADFSRGFDRYVPSGGIDVRVRELRKRLGLTQEELQRKAGLSKREYVTRVEIGTNQMSSHTMRKAFAKGFGLTYDELEAFVDGRLDVDRAFDRIREREAGREPPPLESASRAYLPEGVDVASIPFPELRDIIERDALPAAHRHAIPQLLDLPWRRARDMKRDEWMAEAAKLHGPSAYADRVRAIGRAHGIPEYDLEEEIVSRAAVGGLAEDTDEDVLNRLRERHRPMPAPTPSDPSSDEARAKKKRR